MGGWLMAAICGLGLGTQEIEARDDFGFGLVQADLAPGVPAIVPLLSRVPQVQRAVVSARGYRLRLVGAEAPVAAWQVRAVRHRADQRLLWIDGQPRLAGPPLLPISAEPTAAEQSGGEVNLLPRLARQDGLGIAAQGLRVHLGPTDGRSLLLLPVGGPRDGWREVGAQVHPSAGPTHSTRQSVPPGWHAAVDLGPATEGLSTLTLDGAAIDALQLCALHTPEAADCYSPAVQAATTAPGEVWIERLPEPAEGETYTLLVNLDPAAVAILGRAAGEEAAAAAPAAPLLLDRSGAYGVELLHFEGPDEQLDIRPTMGPGLAVADVNHDGRPDLYLVQGGGREGSEPATDRLFQSLPGSRPRWEDTTAPAGVGHPGAGMGALFFDGDGDGDFDLYLANYGEDALYRGRAPEGEARWWTAEDVTAAAGIAGSRWSAGVAAADVDRDGDLDLYVTSYLEYDESVLPPIEDLPLVREDPLAMLPYAFPGQRNAFYRNHSDASGLRFEDATAELGLLDAEGRGMQPLFLDFDADGAEDLYVANDVSINRLWRNDGQGRFTDVALQTGTDDPRGGMGLAAGDVDLDGDEDLFLTNWQLEANALYVNFLGRHTSQRHRIPSFRDLSVQSGLGQPSVGFTGWGAELSDLDLDGDLDLFVANGYTSPDYESTGLCLGQPNHLYLNDGEGRFELAPEQLDPGPLPDGSSRAALACDLDRDGDEDLLVTNNNGPLQWLENRAAQGPEAPPWLGIELRGLGGNTRAIGARVTLVQGEGTPAARTQVRTVRAGRSYLVGNPPEVHFGLGGGSGPVTVRIDWPSGQTSTHAVEQLSRWHRWSEPAR